ncbi:transcription antitermination factor NusB [Myxococcus sp. MISCRS1]|jgi:N utilization substance protein B|uniref:transcription antitermination factor NusB n=1 Tax=Myxococcus TaxID=32 RepID=UPI0011433128|nr:MULTISPECIES: transcription antitermination factor NusB [Myxococcus]BDT35899.1 transcription antitermination factor NusB [Myxococcus sp. MH1]MBZ4401864.1 transcription antitermination factor NusB [Myxococcus sp. AS-1-15]MBZ4407329.1 transcription antitermination factor NusB [Myxococcus sp. XM-1-1-1]MCK8500363.1 transcription antitermination factor NusB [Myxococcus fulvus]MCY1002533.1 transcription antitermination factor NusB [Myxococcus sp. MISCRS1]
MGARRTGRERALQALYQLEMAPGTSVYEALESAWTASAEAEEQKRDPDAVKFARELVDGVQGHRAEIDRLIESHSHNWRLDRMSRIDRNVLRVGIFELKYRPDIPRKVTINEAVELGKNFGTEESSAFVNGLLDRVAVALKKD